MPAKKPSSRIVFRDVRDGRFAPKRDNDRDPDHHVKERVPLPGQGGKTPERPVNRDARDGRFAGNRAAKQDPERHQREMVPRRRSKSKG